MHSDEEVKKQVVDTEEHKRQMYQMPSIENLLYNLDAAVSHPSRALEFLNSLNIDVDKLKFQQTVQSAAFFKTYFSKS